MSVYMIMIELLARSCEGTDMFRECENWMSSEIFFRSFSTRTDCPRVTKH